MSELIAPSRRTFLRLGLAALAAPAIVRATSLMPIKAFLLEQEFRQFIITVSQDGKTATWFPAINIHELELAGGLNINMPTTGFHVGDIITISGVFKK